MHLTHKYMTHNIPAAVRLLNYNNLYLYILVYIYIKYWNVVNSTYGKQTTIHKKTENTMIKRERKGQNDKQRSTKLTHKTKDRVTRTPLLWIIICCFSCQRSQTERKYLVFNLVNQTQMSNIPFYKW
jgi:hypothetical protein